jgi:2-polyprenyl-3-methyl-5-hydroxy-6-metoxy-1,4-benzoquinol methylase
VANIYSSIGHAAGAYDGLLRLIGYEGSVRDFVSRLPFNPEASFEVLDAGCGTGLYTLAILRRFPHARVTAFDFDPQLVGRVNQKLEQRGLSGRARAQRADIRNLPQEILSRKFDLILTAGVLEYVPIEQVVKNLSQTLVPGGYFVNSPVSSNFSGQLIAALYGCKPYSRKRNLEAFTQNGLGLEELYKSSFFKELHIFKKAV